MPSSFAVPHLLAPAGRQRAVRWTGALVAALAALVLAGWALDLEALKNVGGSTAEMKPNTAAALLLAGMALALPARPSGRLRWAAPACGAVIGLLGMATLAEYMAGIDLGIDDLLFDGPLDTPAGRMSPFTAWCCVAVGTSLLVRPRPALGWLAVLAAAQAALLGLVTGVGDLGGHAAPESMRGWLPPVAVHTGAGFLLVGLALLVDLRDLRSRATGTARPPSDQAVQVAFWSMVAVLVLSTAYTFGSNLAFIRSAQAVADTTELRLDLSRLHVCVHEAQLLQERLAAGSVVDNVLESKAECRELFAALAPRLAAEGASGSALDRLRAALAADAPATGFRDADGALSTLDANHAIAQDRLVGERDERRAAVLVSLLVTVLACIPVFVALARVMREKMRENFRARAETERQKLLLGAVIDSTPDSVAYRSPDGTFLGANAAYARMVGRPLDTLVGHTMADVFGAQGAASYQAEDALVLARGERRVQEDWFTYADGTRHLVEMVRSPLRDADGRVTGVLAVGRNVTERQAAAQQADRARALAEEAAQLKTAFLANMSHEIRTPMTAVLGLIDLLAADDLDARQRRQLEAMRTSGRHLLSIINDILDFSRLEAGKLQLESVDFALGQLLEELRSLLHPMAAERAVALQIEARADVPPFVRGDPTRLRQVLLNLASNAIKFTPQGSVRLVVSAEPAGDGRSHLAFEVRDTGIGIAADKLPRLFSAFTQADESTAREYGGSGLGLAISRRLAEAMGGQLGATSVVGQGSTFRLDVTLPIGEAVAAPVAAGTLFERAAQPRRILVAEDVAINRELLHAALTRQGHVVDFATNGAEAVERVQAARYDVVLMDVQMPVLDGVQATRRIRRLPPPAGTVPILGLTANVLASEQQRYLAAGMDACLTKPIDWQQLAAAIGLHGGDAAPAAPAPAPADDGRALAWVDPMAIDLLRDSCGAENLGPLVAGGFQSASAAADAIGNAGAPATVAAEAHKLKGMAGTMGFARLSATARTIEEAALRGELAREAIDGLAHEIAATGGALRALGLLPETSAVRSE